MSPDETTTKAPPTDPSAPFFSDDVGPPDEPGSILDIEVNPMIRKAVEKHHREWESLMKRHAGRWVIYHGDERLEIGKSQEALYRKYLDRGLKWEELVVFGICPPIEDEHDR